MGEGGVTGEDERRRGAIMSVDLQDKMMREKGGEVMEGVESGAMWEGQAVML